MSKAAVYAGLGQGLMALGQGAGRALEVMSLEKLRAQNLQQNWAREDARFNQEMDFRKNEASQQAEYRNQSLAMQKEANEGLMNYRRDSLQLERDKLARDSA